VGGTVENLRFFVTFLKIPLSAKADIPLNEGDKRKMKYLGGDFYFKSGLSENPKNLCKTIHAPLQFPCEK
jgi:hypothetical protein